MKNEGWTLSDLRGELMERGIDIEDVSNQIYGALDCYTPEEAADEIAREKP